MARPRFLLVAALASLWLTGSLAAADAPLLAGVASADITPPPGLNLWGYTNRTHGATGTLDPLTAKALVLKQGETCVALVALDLGRTPEDPLLEKLRADVRASSGVDHLFATASHTHSAPSLESSDGPNQFGPQVVAAMQRAIDEAARRLAPVTLAIGRGMVELAHNRRRYLPDGRVAMQWRNAEREKTEPVDPRFTVLRLDDADGKPVAVLLHYACHPVVLGPDNYEYSADFVGAARSLIEERLGTTCLFLQGACGNINPYDDKTPLTQGGVELMRRMGRALGQAAVEQARSATPDASREPSLQSVRREIPLKLRWDLGDARVRQILSAAYGRRFDNYLSKILSGDRVNVELNVVLLNEQVALVGMPGEIFVDFQLDLRARSPLADTLLVGYTNGYHAYFPTLRDAAAGGYGGKTATYVAPGSGELLTTESLVTIYKLLGRLHDVPRPEDFELLEWDEIKAGNP